MTHYAPSAFTKKHHNNHSAGLIARLAIDKHYSKKGLGSWLLVDALKKLLAASDTVAFPLIVVDAKCLLSSTLWLHKIYFIRR